MNTNIRFGGPPGVMPIPLQQGQDVRYEFSPVSPLTPSYSQQNRPVHPHMNMNVVNEEGERLMLSPSNPLKWVKEPQAKVSYGFPELKPLRIGPVSNNLGGSYSPLSPTPMIPYPTRLHTVISTNNGNRVISGSHDEVQNQLRVMIGNIGPLSLSINTSFTPPDKSSDTNDNLVVERGNMKDKKETFKWDNDCLVRISGGDVRKYMGSIAFVFQLNFRSFGRNGHSLILFGDRHRIPRFELYGKIEKSDFDNIGGEDTLRKIAVRDFKKISSDYIQLEREYTTNYIDYSSDGEKFFRVFVVPVSSDSIKVSQYLNNLNSNKNDPTRLNEKETIKANYMTRFFVNTLINYRKTSPNVIVSDVNGSQQILSRQLMELIFPVVAKWNNKKSGGITQSPLDESAENPTILTIQNKQNNNGSSSVSMRPVLPIGYYR